MAVIESRVTENGDVIIIKTNVPVVGIVALTSFIDSTIGETDGVVCDVFIQLEVLDDLLLERVVGRRTDPETGKIYHMKFSPPETPEVKARLVQRADDTEEKFSVRLKGYHANTAAILEYFKAKLFTVKVDSASMTPAIIYDIIKAKLDSVYAPPVKSHAAPPRLIISGIYVYYNKIASHFRFNNMMHILI